MNLLSVQEISNICGLTTQAIYYHIRTGRLPVHKIGKKTVIDKDEFFRLKKYDRDNSKYNGKFIYDRALGRYSIAQVAKIVGLNYHQIYYLIMDGQIKTSRVRKSHVIDESDLLSCAKIKDKIKNIIRDVSDGQYFDCSSERRRQIDTQEVSCLRRLQRQH